ncbi:hypothetical protein ABZ023_32890 [Streptomyces sp. NPDC006367]|uniref:hypothetical protein n=1 Tax=unclassified Streptomyces TaxID=2593676 RepID=UPI0033B122F7
MLNIAAKDLYVGAVVLSGTHLETVESLRRQVSPDGMAVGVSFEATEQQQRPGRHLVVEPDHEFTLARVHSVAWIIHSRHRNARTIQDRARIAVPYALRRHWASRQKWNVVERLVEEHTVITHRPLGLDELPGLGVPTPAPPTPDSSRFYRLHRQGPAVLPTGDAVRGELARLAELHRRDHGPTDWDMAQRLPARGNIYNCLSCARSPFDLMPVEIVVERTYWDVVLDDLPSGWEYELCTAAAYERHLLMGTVTPPPPGESSIGGGDIVEFPADGSRHNTGPTARAKVTNSAPGNDLVTGVPLALLAGPDGRSFRRALSGCVRIAPPVFLSASDEDTR